MQGIIYEADLSVRRYGVGGVLSKELIGPLEATQFSIQASNETLTRQAFRIGQAGKDRGSIGRTLATAVNLSVNAVDSRTMALILLGTVAALSKAQGVVAAEEFTAKHDIWVKLDHGNIAAAGVSIDTKTEGTDYVVDRVLGAVMVLSTGTIVDEATTTIAYNYGASAGTTIRVGTESKADVMLEGPAKNRETGADAFIRIPKVTLSPANELSLLNNEYVDAKMTGSCILLDGETADCYIDDPITYTPYTA